MTATDPLPTFTNMRGNYQLSRILFLLPITVVVSVAEAALFRVDDVAFIQQYLEVPNGQQALTSADINGDGHQDLVMTSNSDAWVYLGDGVGEWTILESIPTGPNSSHVVAADFNADEVIDLIVANHDTPNVTLLIGNGSGGFESASNSPLVVSAKPHPHVVDAEDIDGDGTLDLIIDSRDSHSLLLLRGLGAGDFATAGTPIAVGGAPYRGFATGDINGDDLVDLVTPNQNEIGVLLNASSGDVAFDLAAPIPATSPFSVALADLDGNGILDLIAASDSGSLVDVFLGDGKGGFTEVENTDFQMASGAKNLAVGDFNGDGLSDALVTSWSSDALIVLGDETKFRSVRVPLGSVQNPWGLAVTDFNEDGKDDFILADGIGNRATVYLSSDP